MNLRGFQLRSLLRLLVLSLGPAVTFVLVLRYLLAHFYNGGYLLDSGVFAQLMWHNVKQLSEHVPTRQSYYLVHFTPLLSIASLISYCAPISKIAYFCGFVALVSASYAAFNAWLLRSSSFKTGSLLLVSVVSALGALSGLMLGPVFYPHYEQTLCVAIAVFAYGLLVQRYRVLTILAFSLAVLTREDGGLHAGLLLSCIIVAKFAKLKIGASYRQLFVFGVIAFTISAAMIVAHKLLPNSFSSFNNSFADNWESVVRLFTSEHMNARWRYLIQERPWVWLPCAVAVLFAIHFRDVGYLVGYVSNIPWFFLLITADYGATSTFSLYYGFPFIIGHAWAIIWAATRGISKRTVLVMGLSLALAGVQPGTFSELLRADVTAAQMANTESMNRILLKRLAMPSVKFASDASVAAMIPDVIPPERIVTSNGGPPGADVIVFSGCYRLDRENVVRFARQAQLNEVAKIQGTEYYLATRARDVVKNWGLSLHWLRGSPPDVVRCHGL